MNEYMENQILAQAMLQDDSVVKFQDHKDSIFSINYVPREPYNTFISGDCNDKAVVWKITKENVPAALVEGTEEMKDSEPKAAEEGFIVKSVFHK